MFRKNRNENVEMDAGIRNEDIYGARAGVANISQKIRDAKY